MRRVHNVTFGCVVLGLIFAMFASIIATEDRLVAWSGDRQWHFTREPNPAVFWIPSLVAAGCAAAFWVLAWYLHFRRRLVGAPESGPFGLNWFAVIMLALGALVILAVTIAGLFI